MVVDSPPPPPSMPASWDEFAMEYERRVEPLTSQFAEELLQLLLGDTRDRNAKLLDVGCGTGAVSLLALSRYGLDVAATDISEAMVERTKKRGLEEIAMAEANGISSTNTRMRKENLLCKSIVANGMDLPREWSEYFDLAVANFSVVFYPDTAAGLYQIQQCLLPSTGRAAFSAWGSIDETPAFRIFLDVAKEIVPELVETLKPRRTNGSIDSLVIAMENAGFVEVQVVGPVVKTLEVANPSEYYNRFALASAPTAAMIDRMKDDKTRRRFRARVMEMALDQGGRSDGSIALQSTAYLVCGRKPANEVW